METQLSHNPGSRERQTEPRSWRDIFSRKDKRSSSIARLLVFVAFNLLIVNAALILLDVVIPHPPRTEWQHRTFHPTGFFFRLIMGTDSLSGMFPALHMLESNPQTPLYETLFFENRVKFQYPLTSLLPYYELKRFGVDDWDLYHLSKAISYGCVFGTIFLTVLIALRFLPNNPPEKPRRREIILVAIPVVIGSLIFFPLMSGAVLGQIQTVLTFGFTIALFCWISGYEVAAGIILGLMALVKPQYCLFFLWALVRKKFRVAAVGLICAGAIALSSCFAFGFHNNLEYLQVVRFIGSVGEGYCSNQSINGILNRLLFNGNNLNWESHLFAPYNPFVYIGTMASSLALLALALFFPGAKSRRGGVADFACIVLVSTMASPVAWPHHYGIVLPILVWLWFSDYGRRTERWAIWTIAAAYLLISDSIPSVAAVASIPVLNILESYLYFGAILLLILLMKSKASLPQTIPGSIGSL